MVFSIPNSTVRRTTFSIFVSVAVIFSGKLPVALSARAQTQDSFSAAMLFSACAGPTPDVVTKDARANFENICNAFLRGITDAVFVMQSLQANGTKTCFALDQPISVDVARATFLAYLREHPKALQNAAGLVAAMSLIWSNPCR